MRELFKTAGGVPFEESAVVRASDFEFAASTRENFPSLYQDKLIGLQSIHSFLPDKHVDNPLPTQPSQAPVSQQP